MQTTLTSLDLSVIAAYFVVVVWIGVVVTKRTATSSDFFLAGRSLGWLPIALSLFASNISSTTLIGLAGAAYTWGIAVANYEWMAALVLVVFVVFLLPVYFQTGITTIPEYLERRYNRFCRRYFSLVLLFLNIVVDTAGGIFAGALVVKTFFPDIEVTYACWGISVVAGLYTVGGGLAAVVYTDVIQAVVLLVGSTILAFYSFSEIGFSFEPLKRSLPAYHMSLMRPLNDHHLPWLGTLTGVPILGFYFWCTNQFITQRVLAARDVRHARWGSLCAGFLKLSVLFIMVLPGVAAVAIIPNLANGDMVFPTLAQRLLPAGLLGIVLAALSAAIMSSVDSTLNSAATLTVVDFVQPTFPQLSDGRCMMIGRVAVLTFMALSASIAPFIASFDSLFYYLQSALAFIVPPIVSLFTIGVLWSRASASAAMITLVGGHLIAAILFLFSVYEVVTIHFTIAAALIFVCSSIVLVVASLFTAEPSALQKSACFSSSMTEERSPIVWYLNYKVLSVSLSMATVILLLIFW